MRLIKFYIIILILGVSCTKKVEIPIPPNVPKNVVNVILSADSALGGVMSETLSVLSRDSLVPIADGSMLILNRANSQVAYQVNSPSGHYFSNNKAQSGECYTVRFNSNLGESEGIACVPSKPNFDVIDTVVRAQFTDSVLNISIGLNDNVNTSNIYRFTCLVYQINQIKPDGLGDFDTIYEWVRTAFTTSSLSYFVNEYNYSNNAYLLKDDKFNGGTAYLSFSIPMNQTKMVKFYIDAIDNNLFDYYRTLTAQQATQNDPNAHYIKVYSNISNGYGIVGGENRSYITYTKY